MIETLRPLPLRPVEGAPPFVLGLSVLRGEPVPVVELAALLGEDRGGELQRLVSVRAGDRRVALAVAGVLGLTALDESRLQALPPLLKDAGADCVRALQVLDGKLLLVLQSARILRDADYQSLTRAAEVPLP